MGGTGKPVRYDNHIVGSRTSVLFDGKDWYEGTIKNFNPATDEHLVVFDDGDQIWYCIAEELKEGTLILKTADETSAASQGSSAPSSASGKKKKGDAAAEASECRKQPRTSSGKASAHAKSSLNPSASKAAKERAATDAATAGAELVGQTIEVYWELDDAWYAADVLAVDKRDGKHKIKYQEDGVVEKIRLAGEKWRAATGGGGGGSTGTGGGAAGGGRAAKRGGGAAAPWRRRLQRRLLRSEPVTVVPAPPPAAAPTPPSPPPSHVELHGPALAAWPSCSSRACVPQQRRRQARATRPPPPPLRHSHRTRHRRPTSSAPAWAGCSACPSPLASASR